MEPGQNIIFINFAIELRYIHHSEISHLWGVGGIRRVCQLRFGAPCPARALDEVEVLASMRLVFVHGAALRCCNIR